MPSAAAQCKERMAMVIADEPHPMAGHAFKGFRCGQASLMRMHGAQKRLCTMT